MKLAALAAVVLLAPTVAVAPPPAPRVVAVAVGHDRASGFVAGDGLVVTVAHVLDGAAGRSQGGRGGRDGGGQGGPGGGDGVEGGAQGGPGAVIVVDGRPATIVRVDRGNDLALLRAPGIRGEAPRLGAGDGTRLLGRPAPVVRRVNASVDGGRRRPAIVVRVQVAAGDSGAPVLTASGRVAGVLFARSRTRARIAYAVDAGAVARLLDHSPP